jgi:glycosyltransferase involved in cell wall biosynthesis
LGWKQNPYPYIDQAEILVLSSHREGLPLILIEALHLGKPIIASDCPYGPREILSNGKCGILVPPEDVTSLTHALEKLIQNKSLRLLYSRKAKKQSENFSEDTMIFHYQTLISSCFHSLYNSS